MKYMFISLLLVAGLLLLSTACETTPIIQTESAIQSEPVAEPTQEIPPKPIILTYKTRQTSFYPNGDPDTYIDYAWSADYSALLSESYYEAAGDILYRKTLYTYRDGKKVEKVTIDSAGVQIEKTLFEYKDDYLYQQTSINAKGKPVSCRQYSYLTNGAIEKIEIFNASMQLVSSTVYHYNTDGTIAVAEMQNDAGDVFSSIAYEYEKGVNVKEQLLDHSGKVTMDTVFSYENGVMMSQVNRNGSKKILYRTEYTYGIYKELLTQIKKDGSGKILNTVSYQYDIIQ